MSNITGLIEAFEIPDEILLIYHVVLIAEKKIIAIMDIKPCRVGGNSSVGL